MKIAKKELQEALDDGIAVIRSTTTNEVIKSGDSGVYDVKENDKYIIMGGHNTYTLELRIYKGIYGL